MAYATPAFQSVDDVVGVPPLNSVVAVGASAPYSASGTPAVPSGIQALNQFGKEIEAWDPNYGTGEFIYLQGSANIAAGLLVTYDETTFVATLATAASRGPCALALAAVIANTAGWFQIGGAGLAQDNGTGAAGKPYAVAAGQITSTVTATNGIDGMVIKHADAGGFVQVQMDRPALNGNG
jgi:hypothetical protein